MSHPRKQTLTLLNTTEIAENKRPIKLSPLPSNKDFATFHSLKEFKFLEKINI